MKKTLSAIIGTAFAAALSIGIFAFSGTEAKAASSDGLDIYRIYNYNTGDYFYTSNFDEVVFLVGQGLRTDNISWIAPETSGSPVYRLYNPNSNYHHYTLDAGERDGLVRLGWQDEGIGWYSDDAKSVPVYRIYYEEKGIHIYSADRKEIDKQIAYGWQDEGIAFYGISRGPKYNCYGKMIFNPALNANYDKAFFEMREFLPELTEGCSTDYEKVLAVHDWMSDNFTYDYESYSGKSVEGYCPGNTIAKRTGVCSGIARSFDMMMDILGIPCRCPEKKGTHEWNEVYIDGQWLAVDVTWDLRSEMDVFTDEERLHEYFLVDPDILAETNWAHQIEGYDNTCDDYL